MKTSKIFASNLETLTKSNKNYREVVYTVPGQLQVVLMSIRPGEEIGEEVHPNISQFIRVESGEGMVIANGKEYALKDDSAVVIPKGVRHNVVNTGKKNLKLYSIYTPPEHPSDTVQYQKV